MSDFDTKDALMDVSFEGKSGHDVDVRRCLLMTRMTRSGHSCATKRRLLTMIVSVTPRSADIFHLVQISAVALGFHVVAMDEPQ
jgi:hypothetical protein